MIGEARSLILRSSGLEPAERAKVERLDTPLFERFRLAGVDVRACRGRVAGGRRVLEFAGPGGTGPVLAAVAAADFLAADDAAAARTVRLVGR